MYVEATTCMRYVVMISMQTDPLSAANVGMYSQKLLPSAFASATIPWLLCYKAFTLFLRKSAELLLHLRNVQKAAVILTFTL